MKVPDNAEFTKSMRKTHTIYMPDMLHYHNALLKAAFAYGGYRLEIVPEYPTLASHTFSTINKDYCTCATYIVGNLLTMIEELGDDADKIAFLEPQTGGACRAGNYYNLIIDCLKKTGNEQIPVLSLNVHGLEKHSGFKINVKMLFGAIAAVCYSDLLMTLVQQIRPYELNPGETAALHSKWLNKLSLDISKGKSLFQREKVYLDIIKEFKNIEVDKTRNRKKVGIVGEIYIKFSPIGNEHLEDFLIDHNCEYRLGGFINYCIYMVFTDMKSMELSDKNKLQIKKYQKIIDFLCRMQEKINKSLEAYEFLHDGNFHQLHSYAKDILNEHYNIGDGWLIAGEIIDLIEQGYDRILIVHPFGCLVSHVAERGILKKLHQLYPKVGIHSVEFDYEQSKTLRESRILMALH